MRPAPPHPGVGCQESLPEEKNDTVPRIIPLVSSCPVRGDHYPDTGDDP